VASDGADAARQAIRSRALKYELVINLKAALGLEVPMLLARADEVIESHCKPCIVCCGA
jgi:hypothetical protein